MNEWIFVLKIIGSGCIFLGCILFGVNIGKKLESKYEEYEGIRLVLVNLLRNQNYLRQSFPELFVHCADCLIKNDGTVSYVEHETRRLGESLPELSFSQAWEYYIRQLSTELKINENLKNQLRHTGTMLQGMDEDGITMQINQTLEILAEEMGNQRKDLKEKKKVGLSCCIMVGLFTIIILI